MVKYTVKRENKYMERTMCLKKTQQGSCKNKFLNVPKTQTWHPQNFCFYFKKRLQKSEQGIHKSIDPLKGL